MTLRQTYYPTTGENSVFDSAIAYVKMLFLSREGVVYDILTISSVEIDLTSRQVQYNPSTGIIRFDEDIPFNEGETINIVYDTNI